jgi:hypothetical protein
MKEFFEGKNVSVVGNARSLFSTKYGKEIDSAEVVCRIKRGFFQLKPSDSVSHGNKTDVWFLNWFKTMKPSQVTNKTCDRIVEILHHPEIDIEWLKKDLGHHRPSTGLRILHLISLYDPKKVYVYGFDWKTTPSFHNKKLQDDRHNFSLEREYCMKRFFNNENNTFVLRK